jgi:hypothetical protein
MQIAGHRDNSVHGKYGYPHHVTALYPELCKVDYGLDLSSMYVDTAFHISSPSLVTNNALEKLPEEPDIQSMMQAISLAEAYNRIGRKHFGKQWNDYEACLANKKLNLSSLCKKGHDGKPILPPIRLTQLKGLTIEEISKTDKEKHLLVERYMDKAIATKGGVRCYYKPESGSSFYVLSSKLRSSLLQYSDGLVLSRMQVQNDSGKKEHIDVLIDTDSLEQFIDKYIYGV